MSGIPGAVHEGIFYAIEFHSGMTISVALRDDEKDPEGARQDYFASQSRYYIATLKKVVPKLDALFSQLAADISLQLVPLAQLPGLPKRKGLATLRISLEIPPNANNPPGFVELQFRAQKNPRKVQMQELEQQVFSYFTESSA